MIASLCLLLCAGILGLFWCVWGSMLALSSALFGVVSTLTVTPGTGISYGHQHSFWVPVDPLVLCCGSHVGPWGFQPQLSM